MEEIKMLKNYKSFELLEQYLSYLTVIKGRSINTVIEYRTIMFTNSWTQNPENKINYTHE